MNHKFLSAAFVLAFLCVPTALSDEPQSFVERLTLHAEAAERYRQALMLFNEKKYESSIAKYEQVLVILGKLYPSAQHPHGESNQARCLQSLGDAHAALKQFDKAGEQYERALLMQRKMYGESKSTGDQLELATTIHTLATIYNELSMFQKAIPLFKEALEHRRKHYDESRFPGGYAELAVTVNNLGVTLHKVGDYVQALPYFEESLAIHRKLYPVSKFPKGHQSLVENLGEIGKTLAAKGEPAKALPYLEESLAMSRRLYPPSEHPNGHSAVAHSLLDIANVLRTTGAADRALRFAEEALTMAERRSGDFDQQKSPELLAESLNLVGGIKFEIGDYTGAIPYFEKALKEFRKEFPEKQFPKGHPSLASSLTNLGTVHGIAGNYDASQKLLVDALRMNRALFGSLPNGHRQLMGSLNNLSTLFLTVGAPEQALPLLTEALDMARKMFPTSKYPNGHPELVMRLNAVGDVLKELGEYERALAVLEEAEAMCRKLFPESRYPDGHMAMVHVLSQLSSLHTKMGAMHLALPPTEKALTICQKWHPPERFPQGHPNVAAMLSELGKLLTMQGAYERAKPLLEQGYAMRLKLYPPEHYPNGHPEIAQGLSALANLHWGLGNLDLARRQYDNVLAAYEKLFPVDRYPAGHPLIHTERTNLGQLLFEMGETDNGIRQLELSLKGFQQLYSEQKYSGGHLLYAAAWSNLGAGYETAGLHVKAKDALEQSMKMYDRLTERELAAAPEARAANFLVNALPRTRDAYLSIGLHLPSAADRDYQFFWRSKGTILRLLQHRNLALGASVGLSDETRRDWQSLLEIRRQINRLLTSPQIDLAARDRLLTRLNGDKDRLERQLTQAIPALPRQSQVAAFTLADLQKSLPRQAALVDFVRYRHYEKRDQVGIRYLAFIIRSDSPIRRVELGDAKAIDDAIAAWRSEIARGAQGDGGQRLYQLLWAKVAAALPPIVQTVFICPDGSLSRLPFAALPTLQNKSVLLEEYSLAIVPSPMYLLEHLRFPRQRMEEPASLLLVGDVQYDLDGAPPGRVYPALPATRSEVQQAQAHFPGRAILLTGLDARPDAILKQLATARIAHFATHGYFDAASLIDERKRSREQWDRQKRQPKSDEQIGAAARDPLSFVGLACSGANGGTKGDSDSRILTGAAIGNLPLSQLQLTVLSACETGIGDYTEGEGVLGLQRAFHAAGCPNVVASLWKISDAATAALMAKFYHELWVNKKPPIEALREAQLTIYRHPERIPALAGERGKPDFAKTVELKTDAALVTGNPISRRSPTKHWAAFVLSGLGK